MARGSGHPPRPDKPQGPRTDKTRTDHGPTAAERETRDLFLNDYPPVNQRPSLLQTHSEVPSVWTTEREVRHSLLAFQLAYRR